MPLTSLLLAMLLQAGPDPMRGGLPGDDLMQDRPPRAQGQSAERTATSVWFDSCLDQLAEDPARAHAMAQIRRSEASGDERVLANHCLGIAASALGLWDDARAAFLAARDETPAAEARARARFGALAGNAALASGDPEGALGLLTQAETDARAAGAARLEAIAAIDRARALVALGQGAAALGALAVATPLAPENSEGWLLTATLLRRMDRIGEAQAAIERAAALPPGAGGVGPEIGLEAGVIAVLAGREDAARQSWQSVIDLAPESLAAVTATDYLAQLGDAGDTAPTALAQPQETQP